MNYRLTEQDIRLIEGVINQGQRVEIIPTKNDIGINLLRKVPIKSPQKEKNKTT